eukprot:COSAG02_NODE_1139_length_14295_cov_63.689279_5_plen_175_part_00
MPKRVVLVPQNDTFSNTDRAKIIRKNYRTILVYSVYVFISDFSIPRGTAKARGKEVLVPILLTGAKKRTFRGPALWTDGGDRCAAPRGGHRLRHGLHEDGLCGELLAQLHRYGTPSPRHKRLRFCLVLATSPCRTALLCWFVLATSPCGPLPHGLAVLACPCHKPLLAPSPHYR